MAKSFQKRKKKKFKKHQFKHHFAQTQTAPAPELLTQPEEISEPKELTEPKEITEPAELTEPKELVEPKELEKPEVKETLPLPIKRDLKKVLITTVVSLIILAALFLIFKYVPAVQNFLSKIKV